MSTEEWRDIACADGFYEVSNFGRVRSWHTSGHRNRRAAEPKAMALRWNHAGYPTVTLCSPGGVVQPRVHQLVLRAFGPPQPTPQHEVAHLDNNRLNNHISNLAWKTHAENMADRHVYGTIPRGEDCPHSKLSQYSVEAIRRRYAEGGIFQRELAERFGVSREQIGSIIRRQSWAHV